MKKITVFGFAFILAACASINYSDFEISEAVLTDLKVDEIHNLEKREHEIHIAFDYAISDFHADKNLYYCTVQFMRVDGSSVTRTDGTTSPCKLNDATGSVSISWPTPLDKSFNASRSILEQIQYPVEYFVAIHQKTGPLQTRIIGSSEVMASTIEM